MPKRELDPKDKKSKPPKELKAPKNGKRWEHVDRLGDWEPVVPSKEETTVLRDDERAARVTKLDRSTRFRVGKLERVEPELDVPGGGRGGRLRTERSR